MLVSIITRCIFAILINNNYIMKKKKINLSLKKMTVAHLDDNLKRAIKGKGTVGCDIFGNGDKSKGNGMLCKSTPEVNGGAC